MKQAVVIIHGIGEQLPMSTLRGFAAAVLPNEQVHIGQLRIRPLRELDRRVLKGPDALQPKRRDSHGTHRMPVMISARLSLDRASRRD